MLFSQFISADGPAGIIQTIISILFLGMIFLYPRLMISNVVSKLEKELESLETLTEDSIDTTAKAMGGPFKENKAAIKRAIEFFASPPIDVDPTGIVPKLDKTIREIRGTFEAFVIKNADTRDPVKIMNLEAAVLHTANNHMISKIVKHFLVLVKKHKNLQIAMIVQMQMPMIREASEIMNKSVKAFVNEEPVGDGLGPLVAATLAGESKVIRLKDAEMVYSIVNIKGRRCIITKADGPGANIGYPGVAAVGLMKKYKPARVITVDASSKLEGEKTGTLAEGVGVAMNPQSGVVERFIMEGYATRKKIPIDAVVVKMGNEDAFAWMPKEVAGAVPAAVGYVKEKIELVQKGRTVMIMGIGNTVGVGNNAKELRATETVLQRGFKKIAAAKAEKEKDRPFWSRGKAEED